MTSNTLRIPAIYVDADSCPVKSEIVEIAEAFEVDVVFVASYAHMSNETTGSTWKYVDTGKESVDLYIMNHVKGGDVAVTQDIGLASTLLPKGVLVLTPRGTLFDEKDITVALDLRYLSARARRKGVHSKGPKPFSQSDRERFVKELTKILSNFEGI